MRNMALFLGNIQIFKKFPRSELYHGQEFRVCTKAIAFMNGKVCMSTRKQTSRDRPKSEPYPRLKNSKTTSKCQVPFYSTRKSKFFEKKIFEKITYSKKMDRVAR